MKKAGQDREESDLNGPAGPLANDFANSSTLATSCQWTSSCTCKGEWVSVWRDPKVLRLQEERERERGVCE